MFLMEYKPLAQPAIMLSVSGCGIGFQLCASVKFGKRSAD